MVGRWRDAGVEVPESLRCGGLSSVSCTCNYHEFYVQGSTNIMGLFGAVVDGVSVRAEPFVPPCLIPCCGAAKLLP